eukprot:gnl/Trimastix_PCT/717.p1 GENE.gnl/Trimastix_PCT/717~~gnl/Trimastix_PCT/717.p1  ORF type:complete len:938 (+),score=214.92 gnl/Trimastix_PCT/717:41-2854(+)
MSDMKLPSALFLLFCLLSLCSSTPTCPSNLQYCAATERCMAPGQCESSCVPPRFLCKSGQCVDQAGQCCTEGQKYCPTGECIPTDDQCPVQQCPSNKPFQCLDGSCAECADQCTLFKCPSSTPYRCPDLSCAANVEACSCPPRAPHRCVNNWKVECHAHVELCTTTGYCPFYRSHRCTDGTCVPKPEDCGALADCNTPNKRCADGSCIPSGDTCPLANGWPPNLQYRCVTGQCVDNTEKCPPETRCVDVRLPHRCANGLCVSNASMCPPTDPQQQSGCPWNAPYLCATGVCVEYAERCPALSPCDCGTVRYPDGICRANGTAGSWSSGCPPGWYRCVTGVGRGMCVSNSSKCYGANACPYTHPIRCSNGVCVVRVEDCALYASNSTGSGCPPTAPYRCAWGNCVTHPGLCASWNPCPTDRPWRCNGMCVANPEDCPRCEHIRCSDGRCVLNRDQCVDCTTCPLDARFRCANGQCVREYSQCPIVVICPPGEALCSDGQCRASSAECPPSYGCNPELPVRCPDGSCLPQGSTCPLRCPETAPVLCENHACVKDAAYCAATNVSGYCGSGGYYGGGGGHGYSWGWRCPPWRPHRCYDGICVARPEDCANGTTCPPEAPHRCQDGRCVADAEHCPPGGGCPPEYPKICPDGSCVGLEDECPAMAGCPTGQIRCPDGQCREKCPEYNGCPPQYPILCPDGRCSIDEEGCMNGCYNGSFHCHDGSCVRFFNQCAPVPALEKSQCTSYTQQNTGTQVPVYKASGNTKLGEVDIPPQGVVQGTDYPPVRVCSVPDSKLRNYTAQFDFVRTPFLEISSEGQVASAQHPIVVKMKSPDGPLTAAQLADTCLAYVVEATREFKCVGSQVTQAADGTLQGTTDLIGDATTFAFIQKTNGTGIHCTLMQPHKCSTGHCVAKIADCMQYVPSGAARLAPHALLALVFLLL